MAFDTYKQLKAANGRMPLSS